MSASRALFALAVMAFATACSRSQAPALLEPQALMHRVENEGARQVVRSMSQDAPAWESAMLQIAAGTTQWIDVGLALRKGSDAGASSEIESALFLALGQNPTYILQRAGDPPFLLSTICGGRVDPPESYDEALAEIRKVQDAVARSSLADDQRKQLCLKNLNDGEAALARTFGKPPPAAR